MIFYERTKTEQSGKNVMRTEPVHSLATGGLVAAASDFTPDRGLDPTRLFQALRGHIARLESATPQLPTRHARDQDWTFGLGAIDAHLSEHGLARTGLHDVSPRSYSDVPAAMRFTLALALRRMGDPAERRPLLWCRMAQAVREHGKLYGHGIEFMGLARHRFVTVILKRPMDALWVAEEALKSGSVAVVISDADAKQTNLTATRRLSLAAQAGKSAGLLVFTAPQTGPTTSHTRWIASASRSQPPPYDLHAPGRPTWNLDLVRARGGRPGAWTVEWQNAPHRFNLVPQLRSGAIHAGADETGESTAAQGYALRIG
jgi:protein ImuA